MKKRVLIAGFLMIGVLVWSGFPSKLQSSAKKAVKEELGKKLFFDARLSSPEGQSCASCHDPRVGGTGGDEMTNRSGGVYQGALRGRFGNRKPPASSYAGTSPVLRADPQGNFFGGMFWDGRAAGDALADPLAEQALGPFLNPLEQNLPDKKAVIEKIRRADYAPLFERVWGKDILTQDKNIDKAFDCVGYSIAAYERSEELNPFNSVFDEFWRKARRAGLQVETIRPVSLRKFENKGLSYVELNGLALFNSKGKCSNCHVLTSPDGRPPVLTDFSYDNIGVPRNPRNPFYRQAKEFNPDGAAWVDPGLGGFLKGTRKFARFAARNVGKHKTPTLRNVDLRPSPRFVKVYMHNGFFTGLKEVVRFYNTRDVASARWPPPEVAANLNTEELGKLGLTEAEEDAIVAFLKTLSDRPAAKN